METSNGPHSQSARQPDIQHGVRGHFIIFPSYPERVSRLLPALIDKIVSYVCVLFVGSSRPTQEWLKKKAKPLLVRREKVHRALEWLKENNSLYKDIEINYDILNHFPSEFVPPVCVDVEKDNNLESYLSSTYDPIQQVRPLKRSYSINKDI